MNMDSRKSKKKKGIQPGEMPVKVPISPPPPANSKQPGVTPSLLYNGSRFQGYQKSKGNCYDVEVVLQVSSDLFYFYPGRYLLRQSQGLLEPVQAFWHRN